MDKKLKLSETFLRPATVGLIVAGTVAVMDGFDAKVNFFGKSMNMPLTLGGASFVSSLAGEAVSEWVLPKIPKIGKFSMLIERGAAPVLSGATLVGVSHVGGARIDSKLHLFGAGLVSDVAGTYVYSSFVKPMIAKYA